MIHSLPGSAIVQMRWPQQGDASALLAYAQDPDMAETHWFPIPLEATAASIQEAVDDMCKGWNGSAGLTMVAAEPDSDILVGVFTLCRLPEANAAQIAYGVAPQYRRRGVASHGLRLLAPWALVEFNLQRIEARIDRSHAVSRHVAEQAGFICEGNVRGHLTASRARSEDLRYVLRV